MVLTMTADVHKDNLYYAIRAWGTRGESWTVEAGIAKHLDRLGLPQPSNFRQGPDT